MGYPSQTVWSRKERTSIFGRDVIVWSGDAVSSGSQAQFALNTSIAYSAADGVTPAFVNITHPLWTQTAARIDNFSRHIDPHAFDIPTGCFKTTQAAPRVLAVV